MTLVGHTLSAITALALVTAIATPPAPAQDLKGISNCPRKDRRAKANIYRRTTGQSA
jgi:hypothetical protein